MSYGRIYLKPQRILHNVYFYRPTNYQPHIRPHKCLIAAIMLLCSLTGSSQESNSAYDFLNVTSSAKAYGLGGVNISTIGAGIDMIEQNPALLGPELGMAASANYTRWLGSSNFAGAKFAHPINDRMAYAVGLQYYGYGDFEGYNEWGISTGKFNAQDVNFFGSLSHDFTDRLRGGVTVKVIYSGYEEYTAWAMAADLGINYYDDEHDLSLSAVVTNLGGQIKRFTDSYDRLPIDVRLGWSQRFGSFPVRWSVTAWNLTKWKLPFYDINNDEGEHGELVLKDKFMTNLFRHLIFSADLCSSERFYISLGYNYKARTDMATYDRNFFSGLYLGAGVKAGMFGVNVAFAQPHSGGSTLMLNISTDLSKFLKQ